MWYGEAYEDCDVKFNLTYNLVQTYMTSKYCLDLDHNSMFLGYTKKDKLSVCGIFNG